MSVARSMTPPAGGEEDVRPVLHSFTGKWRIDSRRSDSLDGLFSAMGVPWLARKIVSMLNLECNMLQTREGIIISDNTSLGEFTLQLVPDGRWRPVVQVDKRPAPMRVHVCADSGDITIETQFPEGVLMDRRSLTTRTSFEQRYTYRPTDEAKPDYTAVRHWMKIETPEEKAAGEEAEAAARAMLAHRAATLCIVSGGTHDQECDGEDDIAAAEGAAAFSEPAGAAATETPGIAACQEGLSSVAFAGSWVLDRAHSDSMDDMLKLMGLPWMARKVACNLEVTAVMKPDDLTGTIVTEDHSSLGITKSTYYLDGKPRSNTSNDGKVSHVTARLMRYTGTEGIRLPSRETPELGVVLRITSILPDDLGETTDTRVVTQRGKSMTQHLVYVRGGQTVVLNRILTNKTWTGPPVAPVATPVSAPTPASTPSTETARRTRASSSSTEASAAAAEASVRSLDPFFVSLSGTWTINPTGTDDFDAFWRSLGVGWLARWVLGAVDVTTTIQHTAAAFRTDERSGLGSHVQEVPLHGYWFPAKQIGGRLMHARGWQPDGFGDRGPRYLGEHVGYLPEEWVPTVGASAAATGARTPVTSTPRGDTGSTTVTRLRYPTLSAEAQDDAVSLAKLPVSVAEFSTCVVEVETVLEDISGSKDAAAASTPIPRTPATPGNTIHVRPADDTVHPPPAPRLIVEYRLVRRDLLKVTYRHVRPDGVELARAVKMLVRKETAEQQRVAEAAEMARLQHACTLIAARRAAADERRRQFLRQTAAAEVRERTLAEATAAAAASRMSATAASTPPRTSNASESADDYELTEGVQCVIM